MRRAWAIAILILSLPASASENCTTTVNTTCQSSSGVGTVTGPGAACDDNDVTRWDGASSTAIQCSAVTLDDAGAMSGLTGVSSTSVTDSGLTSGRVVLASTGGLLVDDADLTFSVDTLTATKIVGSTSITNSSLTSGRVTLASTAGLLADDADLSFLTDTLTATKAIGSTSVCAVGALDAAGAVCTSSAGVTVEGSTADASEFVQAFGDPTADQTFRWTASGSLLTAAVDPVPQVAMTMAGNGLSLEASDATAGSSVAGAAAGGTVTIKAGAGARLTSGNADAGNYQFVDSAGVGTGASSQLLLPAGSLTNPGLAWTADDDGAGTGIYRRAADRVAFTINGVNAGEFFGGGATSPSLNVVGGVYFTNALGSADAGFLRVAAGEQRADASGSIGVLYHRHSVETVATSKTPTALESTELYTNGADVDGQTFTLLNDPAAGVCYFFALTSTDTSNSFAIAPSAGETLMDGASTCATSFSATAKGATAKICAASGGSGALWVVMNKNGSWTCA